MAVTDIMVSSFNRKKEGKEKNKSENYE